MNKYGLIIINGLYTNKNNIYKAERLKEEFFKLGINIDIKSALDLTICSDGISILPDVSDYDFAIDLDKDEYLAKVISLKIPMINNSRANFISDDKAKTIIELSNKGINVPLSIIAPLCFNDNPDKEGVEKFLNMVESKLSYPLVFKQCHGSLGKQVKLISSRKELEECYYQNKGVNHLYEKFLAKHQGDDYRVIVLNKKVLAVMERINKNDFRSNIALGGKGYDVTSTVDNRIKEMAIKVCDILNIEYAGIDICLDEKDNPCFIEANGNAFFTEIEKVCNKNIAKELAMYIYHKIYK